jgi:hypothetical protein
MDEWVIYRRPEDFIRTKGLPELVPMLAKDYDDWAEISGNAERHRFPVVARGLTEAQARAMIELTKENEDEI